MVLLAGCAVNFYASTPVSFANSAVVPADRTLAFQTRTASVEPVQIKRDTHSSICLARIAIDGKKAMYIDSGEKATVYVRTGQHVVSVLFVKRSTLEPRSEICVRSEREFAMYVRADGSNQYRLSVDDTSALRFDPTISG